MQKIYLDLTPKQEKPVVYVSQFDNDRRFYIQLMEDGTEVQADPSIDYSITIRKPDNNIVTLAYPNVQPMIDGTIRVSLTEQACACYGDSFGELILEENERREGTCNFILNVEISPEFGGIVSASEINNLKRQIDAIINQDAGPIVEEVAGPIVAELVPQIIGDDYYTKTETQNNYFNKTEIQNNYFNKTEIQNNYYNRTQTEELIEESGSKYETTVLYDNSDDNNFVITNIGDTINFNVDITSFDEIIFVGSYRDPSLSSGKRFTHTGEVRISKSTIMQALANYGSGEYGQIDVPTQIVVPSYYVSYVVKISSINSVYIHQKNVSGWNRDHMGIIKIIGVKY